MNENASKSRNVKSYVIICAVILIITALIFAAFGASILAPRFKAKVIKTEALSEFVSDNRVTVAIVSNMSASDPMFGDSLNSEQVLRDGAEINKLVSYMRTALESSVYDNFSDSGLGGWDIRIRLYFDDGTRELFCSDGYIYFLDKSGKYTFKTSDSTLYKYVFSLVGCESR